MISIQDNTIRDGMQQSNIRKSNFIKKEVLKEINKLNINSVEVGMCTTFEDEYNIRQYRDILNDNKEIVVLTRLDKDEINKILNLKIRNLVIKILLPISDLHIKEKLKFTREYYIKRINQCLDNLKGNQVAIDICFEDATRCPLKSLSEYVEIISRFPIRTVTFADTVGCSTPFEYGSIFKKFVEKYPNITFSAHCHNDLGLATANTLAAILNGAKQIETTFLGIGERAGNASIEEIVTIITKKQIVMPSLNLPDVYKVSMNIRKILDIRLAENKPIVGKNIFKHESGIHQDGTRKNISMYQYILPSDLGLKDFLTVQFPISSISSKKILQDKFKPIVHPKDIDEYISFYKFINKFIPDAIPEDTVDLLHVIKGRSIDGNFK
ncbi:LeuA family protein [Staphylococcus argenteus]|uniref:LeuA family protein n=1 Tax=Staphylococcus argenteus TaxID=985002 RepID=UPI0005052F27|nr:LeuA family protein [Staphylococcus argenteus]MBE2133814.1 2-isopropylmalate synthase [Staphylococcus argenteus]MBE2145618.1 2-isopropylmalate synthase [Staphylococcus argenteus]MBE2162496.1 2-isopropylmalate synthase [Staphylococcus argenteus]MCG9798193.1 LeuA family protein [Staphylococcus argenteus]MCG9799117.1 LeuA family protein [Staphylococcus argenteus]